MNRRLQRVDELTAPPEPGRFYLVPMIEHPWRWGRARWWPVLGPMHEDRQWIGFKPQHYHVDVRFFNTTQWRLLGRGGDELRDQKAAGWPISIYESPRWGVPPVWRPARCERERAGFALPGAQRFLAKTGKSFPRLLAVFAGSRLRRDADGIWVCPHKGLALGSCPVEPDGTIICPLHGLRWHADDGRAAW